MALVLVVLVGRGTWDVFKKNQVATNSRIDQLELLRDLESRRDELAAEVSRLESRRGLEEELRTSFPVSAPGEGVVVVSEEVPLEERVSVRESEFVTTSWWKRVKNWFARD